MNKLVSFFFVLAIIAPFSASLAEDRGEDVLMMNKGRALLLPRLSLSSLLTGKLFAAYRTGGERINGGSIVDSESTLPFMAYISREGLINNIPMICGGSIIGPRTILSAARCNVEGIDPANLRVVLSDIGRNTETGLEQIINVSRYVRHPDFNSQTFFNDIALFFTTVDIIFDANVAPIALAPPSPDIPEGTAVTTAGWGALNTGGLLAQQLHTTGLVAITDAECRRPYGQTGVADHMVCAWLPEGGHGICNGDEGGPLFTGTGANAIQWGVASWGYDCGRVGYPSVFTEVTYFLDWIAANNNP